MPNKRDQSKLRGLIERSLEKASKTELTPAARDRALYLQAVHETLDWTLDDRSAKDFRKQIEQQAQLLQSWAIAAPTADAVAAEQATEAEPAVEAGQGDGEATVAAAAEEPLVPAPRPNFIQRQINKLDALDWRIKAQLTVGFALAVVIPFYIFRTELQALGDWGYLGAFLINGLSNATIVLPAPGAIIIALMAEDFNPLLIGIAAGVGGTIGGMSSYIAGAINTNTTEGGRWSRPLRWLMERAGVPVLFVFGAFPFMPGDVASIVAGSVRYPLMKYFLVTGAANVVKMTAIAYMGVDGLAYLRDLVTGWIAGGPGLP